MDRSKAISSSKSSKEISRSLKPVSGSWRCVICNLEFESKEVFYQHKEKHNDLFKQKASKSSVETGQEDDDEEMKKWISFECSICKLVFQTPDDITEHERESHPSRWRQRSQSSVSSFVETLQEDDAEYKKYQEKGWQSWTPCRFCNESFPSSKDLEHHISFVHHPSLIAIMSAVETRQKDEKEIGDVDVDVDDEEEKEIWVTNETAIIVLRMYAQVALEHYNNQNLGKRYALVAHGHTVSTGTMNHINFKAKEEDCPGAPVETFFAQLTFVPFMRVDCCVSLGPSRNLPHWRKGVELGGCRFCRPIIHHPRERVANLILDPFSGRRNF